MNILFFFLILYYYYYFYYTTKKLTYLICIYIPVHYGLAWHTCLGENKFPTCVALLQFSCFCSIDMSKLEQTYTIYHKAHSSLQKLKLTSGISHKYVSKRLRNLCAAIFLVHFKEYPIKYHNHYCISYLSLLSIWFVWEDLKFEC